MRVPLYGDATDDVGAVNLVIGKGTATTGYSLIYLLMEIIIWE
jgi:hypothetical protein